jgi:signal peptidase I
MQPTPAPGRSQPIRRFLETLFLFFCALLIFRAVCAEPYGVPTGSMAPTLLGHHRAVTCPRCGYTVRVGTPADPQAAPTAGAACPNCGCPDLDLDRAPVCPGDRLLVNKNLYDWRTPRRWEMAVFLSPVADDPKVFVKRVVGLPGESIQIRDGDVYIDHEIARKTLAELKTLCIPVFDNNFQPADGGWAVRWQTKPDRGPVPHDGPRLRLEAEGITDAYQWLVYRHTFAVTDKARPVFDEYAYNGTDPAQPPEPVHDFLVECDLEVRAGDGWVAVGLDDGGSEVVAELPVGALKDGTHLSERPDGGDEQTVYRTAPTFGLRAGKTYHVEFAFADRRASLAVDGREVFAPVDRPSLVHRDEVVKPARVGARGVEVVVHNFRLFRDVHYTTAVTRHAARVPVRLGAGQYFVLGDNSPNSDDSRFWSDPAGGPLPVPETSFLGKPFLLHHPSRMKAGPDGRAESRVDWDRVRWLH